VWLAEAHFNPAFSLMPTPLIVAAALSGRTKRIRLGIGVSQLPLHHPVRVAEEAATVDIVSGGRLEFGIGRGTWHHNFQTFGIPWEERTSRFEEAIDIIERAWTEERVSYDGQHYRFDPIEVVPKPLQKPRPPIHIAANSPSTAVFTGRRGLRMLMGAPIHPWPTEFLTHLHIYREALGTAQPAGEVSVSAVFWVYTGKDRAQVRREVAESLARHPLGARTPYEVAEEKMAIFGSPQECIAKIMAIQQEAKLDRLICSFNPGGLVPHHQVMAAMRQFAEEVMPAVRSL
jgi:alkanesulfonate monooxygenase SsuD/methylene tetrahydromethanopterin reductase-like flavin-dependent oxidoreductase (luciferase family)